MWKYEEIEMECGLFFDNMPILIYLPLTHSIILSESHAAHSGLILGLRPANERRRYKVTTSHIGWAQT